MRVRDFEQAAMSLTKVVQSLRDWSLANGAGQEVGGVRANVNLPPHPSPLPRGEGVDAVVVRRLHTKDSTMERQRFRLPLPWGCVAPESPKGKGWGEGVVLRSVFNFRYVRRRLSIDPLHGVTGLL